MDPKIYKKRLLKITDSKDKLKKFIGEFPTNCVLELNSYRVGKKRHVINRKMQSLNKRISQLVINLEAKGPAQEASRIAYAESLGRLARKEYVEHKSILYQACAGYLEREVLEVNKIIPRSDEGKALQKWYSKTSIYNHKAFYNPI